MVKRLFERYDELLKVSSSLPSQTNRSGQREESLESEDMPAEGIPRGRTPLMQRVRRSLRLHDLARDGTDTRGMRYLIPEGEDGHSPSPLLLIHEDRLRTLLELEDALRDIQRFHGGSR